MTDWEDERKARAAKAAELVASGRCPTCADFESGDIYGDAGRLVYEDDLFKVLLEMYPRMKGHTIVVYKPHREDISELSDSEAAAVFAMCVRVVRALKSALGAEKVYLNTMCDGPINHLHLQLFPRYEGERIGSTRFVLPRGWLDDDGETLRRVTEAFKHSN